MTFFPQVEVNANITMKLESKADIIYKCIVTLLTSWVFTETWFTMGKSTNVLTYWNISNHVLIITFKCYILSSLQPINEIVKIFSYASNTGKEVRDLTFVVVVVW